MPGKLRLSLLTLSGQENPPGHPTPRKGVPRAPWPGSSSQLCQRPAFLGRVVLCRLARASGHESAIGKPGRAKA